MARVSRRRKAEEERIRKEEEKARRELIKQEYLRRKQQQILEEQGLGKPKAKPKKPRPKSVHREESCSDSGTKCSSTRKQAGRAGRPHAAVGWPRRASRQLSSLSSGPPEPGPVGLQPVPGLCGDHRARECALRGHAFPAVRGARGAWGANAGGRLCAVILG